MKNIKEVIEKRYHILIIIIICFISLLVINLFIIQIVKHKYYVNKVNLLSQNTVTSSSTPRGRIYDRNGILLVDNEAVKVIYYQKENNVTIKEELALAYKLGLMINIDYTYLTNDILKDFWVKLYKDEADKKISDSEYKALEERKLTTEDIFNLKLSRVTDDELSEFKEEDKEASYIYHLMNIGYYDDEKIIKKVNVTDQEYALVAENVFSLKGFHVRLDWNRVYPNGDVFKTILGTVSTKETGIPYELKDHYLKQGYNLNDRVGTSYLEYQYEPFLKGTKEVLQVLKDGSTKVLTEGLRGNDLVLTIDIKLQKEIETILANELLKTKSQPNTKYYNRSFVIISNPITGEILAMAGKQILLEDNQYKIYDYTPGIATTPVVVGSVVKGASHVVGYNNNALSIDERRVDSCFKIAATPLKCSWTNLGVLNDITALKYSSNVFQFQTAVNVGKGHYQYNYPLDIDTKAFDTYRNTFAQFGLGVKTGIDLPVESTGYKGTSKLAGHLLDFAIGQYDNYTPIQLSQYINTVASGGYRIKPYLLKAIYNPTKDGLTSLVKETTPSVLNKVQTEDKYIKRIQLGFREVMTTSGTGVGYINSLYNAAGKTGTSESFIDTDNDGMVDKETVTNTFIGYAPYDDPKVSFVVVSPDVFYNEGQGGYRTDVNKRISNQISQKYFELYK
ncbi:MAG: penicillin-binding protein 2 [Bacilli bacterium]